MTQSKSGSAGNAMKEAHAMRAALKQLGIGSVEELNEKLAAVLADNPPTEEAQHTATISAGAEVVPQDAETPPDDLFWIDEDLYEVHVVMRKHNVILRPARPRLQPPIEEIGVKPYHVGEWVSCPFALRHENNERQRFLRMKYAKWGHFVITRELAEDCYSDSRWALPSKAVISHEEFRGWSRASRRALGVHRDLGTPDHLREIVRRTLQRFNGQMFVNWGRHSDLVLKSWVGESATGRIKVDPRVVNPYGNHLDEVALPVARPPEADMPQIQMARGI